MNQNTRRLLAVSVVALCTYFLLVAIPQQSRQVERIPLTTSPLDVGLFYEDFITSPGNTTLELAGWWMPATSPRGILVFIHGGGSNRHSTYFHSLKFYRAMVDQKLSVVAIDLRNHGESFSDPRGMQFGRTEKEDALAAIAWARSKAPGVPIFTMGISMGGATIIHAAAQDSDIAGLILLDALLDTSDAYKGGGYAQTGLPPALFAPSAWSGKTFFGFPSGDEEALEVAATLDLPMLVIQDPDDPVTRAKYSLELAARNDNVTYWSAPAIDADHPDLAYKGRWGSHVAAFQLFPEETVAQIIDFIEQVTANGQVAR